jgi:hypothetical protein
MYNTGQAITEDALVPWIIMMIFGPAMIAGGIYHTGQWITRKVKNVLSKDKTKNASKETAS